jgi:hypothetical protein
MLFDNDSVRHLASILVGHTIEFSIAYMLGSSIGIALELGTDSVRHWAGILVCYSGL